MKLTIITALFLGVSVSGSSLHQNGGYELAKTALTEYLNTGKRPTYLDYAFQHYQLPHLFRTDHATFDNSQVCTICEIIAEIVILERHEGMTDVQLAAEVSYFCTSLNIENERVCTGIINANVDIFTYVIDNNADISGKKFCSLILQSSNCDKGDNYEWTVDIPSGTTVEKRKANETKTFNILQVSDIHFDPLYTPGKTNKCGEPVCCQVDQADGTNETDTCGYWSDNVISDVPLHLVEETLKQTTKHEFDYVYYTGDFISHRVWATSIANNSRDISTITDVFRQYYTVPVYPILGNHEPHPLNAWSSKGVVDETLSTQWLFDLIAEEWSNWLTDDAKSTVRLGGYYTLSPKDGFRIIVINSNVCYVENWWLVHEDEDPYGQLAWLAATLLAAEENKEIVHILSHIPTGSGACLKVWSREYHKIIERFANTIAGQFNGHSHRDTFSIFYASDTSEAVNVAWNGGSLIVDKANPNYKLYKIDDETFDVLDIDQWTFNLTLANLDPQKDVDWYKLYSFKESFGVASLEPSELDALTQKMTKDHSLIDQYYRFKFRNSDYALSAGCDETCQKSLLCEIVTTVYGENEQCEKLQELYDQN